MKSLHSKLSGTTSFVFSLTMMMYSKRKKMMYLFFCFALISLTGCFRNFYKTNTQTSIDANTASKFSSENKYFIIHFLESTNGLENVYVKDDSIYGKLVHLPAEHSKHLHPPVNDNAVGIRVVDKEDALKEIHLYTNMLLPNPESILAANLNSFYRIDVYEFNEDATKYQRVINSSC